MSGNGQPPRRPSNPGAAPPSATTAPGSERPTDAEIDAAVRALQAGAGDGAFDPIFRRYYASLRNHFTLKGESSQDAEELAQEALYQAFRKIDQFRSDASFSSWLWKIGENLWHNRYRDRNAVKRGAGEPVASLVQEDPEGREVEMELADRDFYGAPRERPQEEALLREERTQVLWAAVNELPDGQRRVLELRMAEDLKYDEVADRLGVSLGTVRSQLNAARERLRPLLQEYFGDAHF